MNAKEFYHKWLEGVRKITLLQQTKISLISTILILMGILIGIYSAFITQTSWLLIIFAGSLVLTIISVISQYQKCYALQKIEEQIKVNERGLEEHEYQSTGI